MSRHARGARYGRYVEGPDPLAPPVDLGDALSVKGGEDTPPAEATPEPAAAIEAPPAPAPTDAPETPAADDPQADLFGPPGPRP